MFGLFKSKAKTVRVPLEVLSVLWTDPDGTKTHVYPQQDIANDGPKGAHSPPHATDQPSQHGKVSFNSWEIQDFYEKSISERIRGQALNVIVKLLQVLDEKGACPSIVQGDHETPEEYSSLGCVTLTEHSLNVARIAFHMLNSGRRIMRNNAADALIAALGHDLGKIPDLARKEIQGHTFSSMAYLKPLLVSIESGENILEAVRLLHVQDKSLKGKNKSISILQVLEQADMQARQVELKTLKEKEAFADSSRANKGPNACEGNEVVSCLSEPPAS